MRRIKLVLGALAVMVAAFAGVSGPAMADDLNCRDARGDLVRCDGQLFEPINNNDFNNNDFNNNDFNNNFFFVGVPVFFGFESSCPFWGDTEGIVNQWDCF